MLVSASIHAHVTSNGQTYTVDSYGDLKTCEPKAERKASSQELGEVRPTLRELPMNAQIW